MRLAHIMPVNSSEERKQGVKEKLQKVVHPGTEIEVIDYSNAPRDLEYYEDDIRATMIMLDDRERLSMYDGISIACFYDPGLRELREVLDIPVTGIGLAAMTIANMLGSKTAVIVGRDKWIPKMRDNSIQYGMDKNVQVWRSVNLTVSQLKEEPELTRERIIEQTGNAVEIEKAETIIMGCAAIDNLEEELQEKFHVPVVNPIVAGIKVAEMMASLRLQNNLSHSKRYDYEGK